MSNFLSILSIIFSVLSIWGSVYFAILSKRKRIFNNYIYFHNQHWTNEKITQDFLNNFLNEYNLISFTTSSDALSIDNIDSNYLIKSIKDYRFYYLYSNQMLMFENQYKEIMDRKKWCDRYSRIRKMYAKYENDKNKICDCFNSGMTLNGVLINGKIKSSQETLKDIESFLEDNNLLNLLLNCSVSNHDLFMKYYNENNYKNNIVFSNDFYFENLNDAIAKANDIYNLWYETKLNKNELVLNTKKTTIKDLLFLDLKLWCKKHKLIY